MRPQKNLINRLLMQVLADDDWMEPLDRPLTTGQCIASSMRRSGILWSQEEVISILRKHNYPIADSYVVVVV